MWKVERKKKSADKPWVLPETRWKWRPGQTSRQVSSLNFVSGSESLFYSCFFSPSYLRKNPHLTMRTQNPIRLISTQVKFADFKPSCLCVCELQQTHSGRGTAFGRTPRVSPTENRNVWLTVKPPDWDKDHRNINTLTRKRGPGFTLPISSLSHVFSHK